MICCGKLIGNNSLDIIACRQVQGHVSVIANFGHLLPGVTACCDSLVLLLMLLSQLIFKKVINDIAQLYHSDDY